MTDERSVVGDPELDQPELDDLDVGDDAGKVLGGAAKPSDPCQGGE